MVKTTLLVNFVLLSLLQRGKEEGDGGGGGGGGGGFNLASCNV